MSDYFHMNIEVVQSHCECCDRDFEEPKTEAHTFSLGKEYLISYINWKEDYIYEEDLDSFLPEIIDEIIERHMRTGEKRINIQLEDIAKIKNYLVTTLDLKFEIV